MNRASLAADQGRWLTSSIFTLLNIALLIGALALSARELLHGGWTTALAWAACAAVAIVVHLFRDKLPPFFGLMLTSAALVNAAGYVFNLWHQQTLFDESVHAFTTFAVMGAAGWFWLPATHRPSTRFFLWFGVAGVLAGVAWEIFEWAIGIIGDLRDTLIDLVMDSLGLAAAGFLLVLITRNRSRGYL